MHRINNINRDTKRGDCSVCGLDVSLYWRAERDSYMCRTVRREQARRYTDKKNFGPQAYAYRHSLLEKQDSKCGICQDPITIAASLDHCHTSGQMRGLLCQGCNLGLGHFRDNKEALLAAVAYLEGF